MKAKKAPNFRDTDQEAAFWEAHSAADFNLQPVSVEEVLEELKARHQHKKNVTFRLEPELLKRLKKQAQKMGVKYQTFIREWLWRAVA